MCGGPGRKLPYRSPAISVGVHYTHRAATHVNTHSERTHERINTNTHTAVHVEFTVLLLPHRAVIAGGQMCAPSPHYKLTMVNMFLWTSPAPPTQTDARQPSSHEVWVCVTSSLLKSDTRICRGSRGRDTLGSFSCGVDHTQIVIISDEPSQHHLVMCFCFENVSSI